MSAIWGVHDCWSWLAPPGAVKPDWLAQSPDPRSAELEFLRRYGSWADGLRAFGVASGLRKLDTIRDIRATDRVLIRDQGLGITGAKLGDTKRLQVMTPWGLRDARVVEILEVWRPCDSST